MGAGTPLKIFWLIDLVAVLVGYHAAIYLRFPHWIPPRNWDAFQSFLPFIVLVYAIESFLSLSRRSRAALPVRHAAAFLAIIGLAYALRDWTGALPSLVLVLGFVITLLLSLLTRSFATLAPAPDGSALVISAASTSAELLTRLGASGVEHEWIDAETAQVELEERLRGGAYHIALWEKPPADPDLLLNLLYAARAGGTRVVAPNETDLPDECVTRRPLADRALVELLPRESSLWSEVGRRAIDLALLFVLLPFAVPLIFALAVAIRLDSPGPAFYRQRRLGLLGEPFEMVKLRTMPHGVEEVTGPVWPRENDPRATRIGRLLRALGLDELPQLLHVMEGTMSIVGPRPERGHFVGRHAALGGRRLLVRPGLTGLAQARLSKDAPITRKIRWDRWYIRHRTMGLDLTICLLTTRKLLGRFHAATRREPGGRSAS
jgi:lipopolysaccharide/colanic/teichoic acid biosynthesis glycosyltransferase